MTTPPTAHESPPWGRNVKVIVSVALLLLAVLIVWRFSGLLRQVVIAGIIAYLLNPLITLIDARTPLRRGHAIILVHLGAVVLLVWGVITLGIASVNQLVDLIVRQLPDFIARVAGSAADMISQTFVYGPYMLGPFTLGPFEFGPLWDGPVSTIPWNELRIEREILALLNNSREMLLQRGTSVVSGVAAFTFSTIGVFTTVLLIFFMSIYISSDIPRLGNIIGDWAQLPGYRKDAERLSWEFGRIWRAYLRGQVILAITIFLVVWLLLSLAGVNNAFALGVIAGLLEFLPIIGPVISTIVATLVAVFQSYTPFGLEQWQYALLIIAIMFVVQQMENSILVPRIVGDALDLHPIVTLLAVFIGTSLAGILGAVLAAPVAATLQLLGGYAWNKLFDQPPFPQPAQEKETPERAWLRRLQGGLAALRARSPAPQAPAADGKRAEDQADAIGEAVAAPPTAQGEQNGRPAAGDQHADGQRQQPVADAAQRAD